jgi:hypothetical protein
LILFLFGPALILPGLSISPGRDFQLPSPAWFPATSRRSFSSACCLLLHAHGFSSPAGLLRPGALHSAGPHATGSPPPVLGTSVSSSVECATRSFFLSRSFFYQFHLPLLCSLTTLAGSDFLLPPTQQTACRVPLAAEVFGPLLLGLECACPPALSLSFHVSIFFVRVSVCGLL